MEKAINQNLIKALRCLGSNDGIGGCYCDRFNAAASLTERPMRCQGHDSEYQKCPYWQDEYGVCFEDGECGEWLFKTADILEGVKSDG